MVITLDKHKRPLGHCTERRARILLSKGRACIYRYFPFIIIVKDADAIKMEITHKYRIKIDSGSKHTGIAVVEGDKVILMMQIEHRGDTIHKKMMTRAGARRNRRSRETRYRHPKFKNGEYTSNRVKGWLPPSVKSAPDNIVSWVTRLTRWLGPCDVTIEFVKFDTQLMDDPNIEGREYQHGTLFGYELKAYLREKYRCTCQYCNNKAEDFRFEWEHKLPRSRRGSDKVSNATLACKTCNDEKGTMTPKEWLESLKAKPVKSELDNERIKCLENVIDGKIVGGSDRYAAWMNSTRWYLYEKLKALATVKSIELATGGRTAMNREKLGYVKDHHLDALCTGEHIPDTGYKGTNQLVLMVKAMGRGSRLLGQLNECGVITNKWHDHHKRFEGYETGDIVKVDSTKSRSKYAGRYVGRISIRQKPTFYFKPFDSKGFDVNMRYMRCVQKNDGYAYLYKSFTG